MSRVVLLKWAGRVKTHKAYLDCVWLYVALIATGVYVAGLVDDVVFKATGPLAVVSIAGFAIFTYRDYVGFVRKANSMMSWASRLPTSMHMLEQSDSSDHRTIALGFSNGSMSTIEVPSDYNPRNDGGVMLLEKLFGDVSVIPEDIREIWTRLFSS